MLLGYQTIKGWIIFPTSPTMHFCTSWQNTKAWRSYFFYSNITVVF